MRLGAISLWGKTRDVSWASRNLYLDKGGIRNNSQIFVNWLSGLKRFENLIIIRIIDYHQPMSLVLVFKPVLDNLGDINLRVVSSRQPKCCSNSFVILEKSSHCRSMDPEHRGLWRILSITESVFQGNLWFSRSKSAIRQCNNLRGRYPIPPRPYKAVFRNCLTGITSACWGTPSFFSRVSMIFFLPKKRGFRGNGTMNTVSVCTNLISTRSLF